MLPVSAGAKRRRPGAGGMRDRPCAQRRKLVVSPCKHSRAAGLAQPIAGGFSFKLGSNRQGRMNPSSPGDSSGKVSHAEGPVLL